MYQTYYALNKKPFEISPDPEFLWLGENHKEALAHLKYGILENKGFLLITGEVGTGKTTLINRIVKLIDVAAIVVTIPDPDMTKLDFFNFLGNELNMERTFSSKGEFLIYFKDFMLNAYRSHKKILLVIDEAQRLNHELLLEISILSNIDFDGRMLLNVFFVGQTEFNALLMDDRNAPVRKKIALSYHLDPLKKEEISNYINHRLRVAGQNEEFFTSNAIRKIYSFSNGYPRLINIICDRALLTAYTSGVRVVDTDIIKECGKELAITIGSYRSKKHKAQTRQKSNPQPGRIFQQHAVAISAPILITLLMSLGFIFYLFSDTHFFNSSSRTNEQSEIQVPYQSLESFRKKTLNANTEQIRKRQDLKNIAELDNQSDQQIDKLSPAQDSLTAEQKNKFVVYYDYDSTVMQPFAIKKLNQISNVLDNSPSAELTIKGFTDSLGNETYNKYISVERASNVKKYLINRGIQASKIKVIGMGTGIYQGRDMTFEERRKNRRVEIEIKMEEEQKP